MDSEKFLKTRKWQDCFNSLSDLEMKIATIFTILDCPNQTCRKTLLYKRVLHYLGVRTSQNPKLEFKKSIDKTISQLITLKIFKEYNKNKEHPRVKFDKSKAEQLEIYLRRYFKSELPRNNATSRLVDLSKKAQNNNLEFSLFEQESIEEDKIPSLDSYLEDELETDETYEIENSNDDIDESLLDRFLDDELPEISEIAQQKSDSKNTSIPNIKEKIINHFSKVLNLKIEDDFSEIIINLNGNVETFAIIEIDQLSNSLNCFVVIEYLGESTKQILKALSKSYTNITLCIDEYNDKEVFSLKQKIDITRYNELEIISIIESLLKTSRIVTTIIEKHL